MSDSGNLQLGDIKKKKEDLNKTGVSIQAELYLKQTMRGLAESTALMPCLQE